MPELDTLFCSRCNVEWERPFSLALSNFQQVPFVCPDCRCKDCGIVLDFQCECELRHAERSKEDNQVCAECVIIRKRVSVLDAELLELRNTEIAEESKHDSDRNFRRRISNSINPIRENL